MAGVQPVDELYDAITSYLTSFKQHTQETMKEFVKREGFWWEQLHEAVALTDGKDKDIHLIEPMHEQLRGMLLLRRSVIQAQDYPMLFKDSNGVNFENQENHGRLVSGVSDIKREPRSLLTKTETTRERTSP